jgi:hypothetical protein
MERPRRKSVSVTALAKFFAGRSYDDRNNVESPPAAVRRAGEAEHARHDSDVKRFARRNR